VGRRYIRQVKVYFKLKIKIIVNMAIAIGQKQDRGPFDLIDDWLSAIVSFSLVGLDFFYSLVHF